MKRALIAVDVALVVILLFVITKAVTKGRKDTDLPPRVTAVVTPMPPITKRVTVEPEIPPTIYVSPTPESKRRVVRRRTVRRPQTTVPPPKYRSDEEAYDAAVAARRPTPAPPPLPTQEEWTLDKFASVIRAAKSERELRTVRIYLQSEQYRSGDRNIESVRNGRGMNLDYTISLDHLMTAINWKLMKYSHTINPDVADHQTEHYIRFAISREYRLEFARQQERQRQLEAHEKLRQDAIHGRGKIVIP